MRKSMVWGCLALAGALVGGVVANSAAESVADFYKKKKQIKMIISAGSGGGYAAYTVTLMKHMGRYIPGNPSFVRQHRQGAGGLVAANWLYNKAPRDGSVMGIVHREAVSTVPLYGAPGVRFNPSEFGWIGSMNKTVGFCVVWHTYPAKTFLDLRGKGLVVGGVGAGSGTDTYPRILNNMFGMGFKLITGYGSGQAVNLAMERGEVQGRCAWSWSAIRSTRGDWLRDKKIKLLLQLSLTKHPAVPDVPLITSLAKTDKERAILKLILTPFTMGRPFLTPPGVPKDRLAALRTAFNKTMADPAFLKDAKKRHIDISLTTGKDIEKLIKDIYALPKDIITAAQNAVKLSDRIQVTVKKIPTVTVKTKLIAVKRKGRRLKIMVKGKTHTVKVSSRRSKVTIAGKKAKRSKLKAGMVCEITYKGDNSTGKLIAC